MPFGWETKTHEYLVQQLQNLRAHTISNMVSKRAESSGGVIKYLCDCESSLQTYNRVMPREVSSKIVDIPELVRTTLKAAVARRGVFETITKKQCEKTPCRKRRERMTNRHCLLDGSPIQMSIWSNTPRFKEPTGSLKC